MTESKIQATERLRAEARWPEASQFKDKVLRELRTSGMTKAEASEKAWAEMIEKYPPFPLAEVEAKSEAVEVRIQGSCQF